MLRASSSTGAAATIVRCPRVGVSTSFVTDLTVATLPPTRTLFPAPALVPASTPGPGSGTWEPSTTPGWPCAGAAFSLKLSLNAPPSVWQTVTD
jgi:hypothetical protein